MATKPHRHRAAEVAAQPVNSDELLSTIQPATWPGSHHLDSRVPYLMTEGTGDPDDLLNTSDVAEWLGTSTQWLEIGRHKGYGPPYIRVSPKRIRYRRGDVLSFLAARKHHCTSEYV